MNKNMITAVVVVALAVVGFGVVALKNNENKSVNKADEPTVSHNSSDNNATTETSSNQATETNNITYKGFAVVQKTVKVKKGTTVTWTNEDNARHDVTPDKETEDFKASKLFGKGETYSVTFNTVGTYSYYCSPHPYMKGTIEVVE